MDVFGCHFFCSFANMVCNNHPHTHFWHEHYVMLRVRWNILGERVPWLHVIEYHHIFYHLKNYLSSFTEYARLNDAFSRNTFHFMAPMLFPFSSSYWECRSFQATFTIVNIFSLRPTLDEFWQLIYSSFHEPSEMVSFQVDGRFLWENKLAKRIIYNSNSISTE